MDASSTVAASSTKAAPARPRWRWFQFSLKTLMFATVVIAVGLGLGTSWYRRASRQAAAVSTLRRFDNGCYYEGEYQVGEFGRLDYRDSSKSGDAADWKQVQTSLFHDVGAVVQDEHWDNDRGFSGWEDRLRHPADRQEAMQRRDETWRAIAALETIEYLNVNGSIPPHGLEALPRFTQLRILIVGPAAVPPSLEPITQLQSLEHLELDASTALLTARAMEAIGRMPRLRHLGFPRTRLEEGHLRVLAETSRIESLDFHQADIKRGAMEALRGLSHLKRLSLRGTAADDSWGKALAELTSLEELDVSETNLGPAFMESLARLPKLRTLNTSRTNITGRAINQFQKQNPTCKFVWGGDRYR